MTEFTNQILKWLRKSITDLMSSAKKGPLAKEGRRKQARVLIGIWKASLMSYLLIVLSVMMSYLVVLGGRKCLFFQSFSLVKRLLEGERLGEGGG